MVKFNLHYVNEPLLKVGNWVKIEFGRDSEADVISQIQQKYPEALLLAQNEKLPKIEIEFPSDWTRLPNVLQKLNFLPAIKSYLLTAPFSIPPSTSPDIISQTPKFDDLVPLLREQADYHSQLYPNYYKAVTDIDWEYYRKYLNFDLQQSSSIFLTYQNPDHQPVGFIFGGQSGSRVVIWEMIVSQTFRSQGIGRQLLQQFIYLCFQKPTIKDIEVETGWNQLAAGLYLKSGFFPHTDTWYQNL
jgi:GNAT superfamily N-acetyltransferase